MARAILSIFLGFALVSPSDAETHILTPDALTIELNFEALSAPTIGGPMCFAKPRPLPCGADCWRAQFNENSEPAPKEQEVSALVAALQVDLSDLGHSAASDAPILLPALGDSEASHALDLPELTEAFVRKTLERLETYPQD